MSSKQDGSRVRTAEDLERKYDLQAIVGLKKAAENSEKGLMQTNAVLEDFIVATLGSIENLQSQIDGNISTWFYSGSPTMDNIPANEWVTDDEKTAHLGDLYYDQNTGYAYRFSFAEGVYGWLKITDNDVVEALALANTAQDTADGKRRVFTDTPYPPYDVGDLWFKDKEIYICSIAKKSGEKYEESDFGIATKYTDDTKAEEVESDLKKNYLTTVDTKAEITKSAEGILLNVSKVYTTKAEFTNQVTALDEKYAQVKVSAEELLVKVSSNTTLIDGLGKRMTNAESSITQHSDLIATKVSKDGVISSINQSAETIQISASKINLVGAVTFTSLDSSTQSQINTAINNSSSAIETANSAKTTANSAASTASTANTNASNALTKANTAVTTANTANSNASAAVTTANAAKTTANAANQAIANWCYNNNTTYIDGANIYTGTISAAKINVSDLFAQTITATGNISNTASNGSYLKIDMANMAIESVDTTKSLSTSLQSDYVLVGTSSLIWAGSGNVGTTNNGGKNYPFMKMDDGVLTLNATNYDSRGILLENVRKLALTGKGIYSPYLSTDGIGCPGTIGCNSLITNTLYATSVSVSGVLTASGKIQIPTTGSSWISGKTLTNASIAITTKQTTGYYHPIMAVQSSSGNVWNIGGLGDNVGIYGFLAARTANATDWYTVWNTNNGAITTTGTFTAASVKTSAGADLDTVNSKVLHKGEVLTAWADVTTTYTQVTPTHYNYNWSDYKEFVLVVGCKAGGDYTWYETRHIPYFLYEWNGAHLIELRHSDSNYAVVQAYFDSVNKKVKFESTVVKGWTWVGAFVAGIK